MSISEQILESMARTLFVIAYADACDEADSCEACDPEWDDAPCSRFADAPRAGAGENWSDVAPDAEEFDPQAAEDARKLAACMLAEFERLNAPARGRTPLENATRLQSLLDEWCSEESQHYGGGHNAESFGHYIVMQSLGHGVGLNDDTGPGCREWKTGYFSGLSL